MQKNGGATRWWYGAVYMYFLPDNKERGLFNELALTSLLI